MEIDYHKDHPDYDMSTMSLRDLKKEITSWEHEHIRKNGLATCSSPDCLELYKYFRNVYACRYRREKLKLNNTWYIDEATAFSSIEKSTGAVKHTLFANHPSAFVHDGDYLIVEEEGIEVVYVAQSIDKINYESFKAVVTIKNINKI